jgi:carbon-monoxide dehydrogenase large subunit
VLDALQPLGIKDIQMPMTPARLWTAIAAASRADNG